MEQTAVTEPIEGGEASVVHPSRLGGTRHLSAAQFVHDQRDAVAMVASQDGRFTIFCWSPVEGMVHAPRRNVVAVVGCALVPATSALTQWSSIRIEPPCRS